MTYDVVGVCGPTISYTICIRDLLRYEIREDLVQLKRLNDPVAVGVEDPEQALDDALKPVAHRKFLVCWIGKLDEE